MNFVSGLPGVHGGCEWTFRAGLQVFRAPAGGGEARRGGEYPATVSEKMNEKGKGDMLVKCAMSGRGCMDEGETKVLSVSWASVRGITCISEQAWLAVLSCVSECESA